MAIISVAAVLALTVAAIGTWRVAQLTGSASTAQPHPDPTPAPEGSVRASTASTPTPSPTPTPTRAKSDPTPLVLPTNPARWPVVPHIDASMKQRLRAVFLQGQTSGNREDVFAKVGDSITASPSFLTDIGCGAVSLGDHADLLPAITAFSQATLPPSYATAWCGISNSFTRTSVTAVLGWTAAAPLEPFVGTPPDPACDATPFDAPLTCELHLLHPSIALIMFGTNDVERSADPSAFAQELDALVGVCITAGVIPILSTIPPRPTDSVMDARVEAYNEAIVRVASADRVPLINYWRALVQGDTVNEGISGDGVHPNVYEGCIPHCQATDFTAQGLRYGYNVRNLTALEALEKVLDIVFDDGTPDRSPV